MKGVSLPRVKDKHGNNIKQHFGLWKYFIDVKNSNKKEEQKKKCYIGIDCRRYESGAAVKHSQADSTLNPL